MKSPLRLVKRKIEIFRHKQKRLEIEKKLSKYLGGEVELIPASAKGGYDEIYYGLIRGKKVTVVRVNSKFKAVHSDLRFKKLRIPLGKVERLEREWMAYSELYQCGIAPQPLWKNSEAIACSWLNWNRASIELKNENDKFWYIIERVIPTVATMHSHGIAHMDLNLGNLLIEPQGEKIAIIDFEYAPSPWLKEGQQFAFDYLKLIDDCIRPRRGGKKMLSDIPRLIRILETHVCPTARKAEIKPVLPELNRLNNSGEIYSALKTVFVELPP